MLDPGTAWVARSVIAPHSMSGSEKPVGRAGQGPVVTPYHGRRASLATKHGKAVACGRPFRHALGVELIVPNDLDTDALGTFSGEIPRQGAPEAVCLHKARLGMAATGLRLGFASEGSFGPHPFVPFIPADYEILTFVDDDRGLVIIERVLSVATNFGHREARSVDELSDWLAAVGFPLHGLIVRPKSAGLGTSIDKGVTSIERLTSAIDRAAAASDEGLASVETDMRAHLNPTRMTVIRKLAFRLARRLATPCPGCAAPGFGRTGEVSGLPCEWCESATEMIRLESWNCAACSYHEERLRRDGLRRAPAQHCPHCNP